jgi:hypothetical protein
LSTSILLSDSKAVPAVRRPKLTESSTHYRSFRTVIALPTHR